MTRVGVRNRVRTVVQAVLPSLRVIGMAYAGLIGVGATALVVSVAFLPVGPVLQEATQPARDAVGTLVQPATEIVTSLIVGSGTVPRDPFLPFAPASQVAAAPARSAHSLEENVPEAAASGSAADPAVVTEARPIQSTRALVASASFTHPVDVAPQDAIAEDVPVDEPAQAVEVTTPQAPAPPVAGAPHADSPVLQAASAEAPRPLPPVPVPVPTEATWQTRARLDAENQAAIDAAKALVVDRKAHADAANQAAIDFRKAVTVNPVATSAPTNPASPAAPQARAAVAVDNQTLIDTTRAGKAQARADANAANQAAIDAAKAPRSVARATARPAPAPAPAPAASTPTPLPIPPAEPTPTNVPVKVLDSASLDLVEVQPSEQNEVPVMLAEDAPQD